MRVPVSFYSRVKSQKVPELCHDNNIILHIALKKYIYGAYRICVYVIEQGWQIHGTQ